MSTIVEEFVIAMGLDPSGVSKGSKQVREDLKRVGESGKAAADVVETGGKRAAEFFASLRTEVVGLFLAFSGAKGLKDFVGGIVEGDAATGRFAKNIGLAANQVAGWQGAVESVGGKATEADAALRKMADGYQNLIHTGQSGMGQDLAGLGIKESELKDGPQAMLMKLAEASKRFSPNEFRWRAERLGISDGMISLLDKGSKSTGDLVEHYRELSHLTEEQVRNAQAFDAALTDLEKTIKGLARPEIEALAGAFAQVIDGVNKNTEAMPVLVGIVGSLGVAATVAAGPWIALAAAIGAAYEAYHAWKNYQNLTPDEKKTYDGRRIARRDAANAALMRGDIGAAVGIWKSGLDDLEAHGNKAATGSTPGPVGATLGGDFGAVAGRIRASESRGDYNKVVYGLRSPRALTSMSLGEIFDWQRGGLRAQTRGHPTAADPRGIGSTGVGAYQFESQTLAGNAAALFGANWRSQAFSAANQDRIAEHLFNSVHNNPLKLARTWAVFNNARTMSPRAGVGAGSKPSQNVTVSGPITIYVPSGDPKAIARGLKGALDQRMIAAQANTGVGG